MRRLAPLVLALALAGCACDHRKDAQLIAEGAELLRDAVMAATDPDDPNAKAARAAADQIAEHAHALAEEADGD